MLHALRILFVEMITRLEISDVQMLQEIVQVRIQNSVKLGAFILHIENKVSQLIKFMKESDFLINKMSKI